MLEITLNTPTAIPIEVEGVTPDRVAGLPRDQLERLPVYLGNQQLPLAELFAVDGDPSSGEIAWQGNLEGVHWIGAKMQSGTMRVLGSAGRHLGSEMSGGTLIVDGDAGDWVGGEMHGGVIEVRGRAGHLVGAAYRGSRRGMTGGTILIHGRAGNEIGHTMRRGLIVVAGDAGDLIGFNMIAGSIFVFGDVGIRHAAGMRRGTVALLGPHPIELLPTFSRACRFRPPMLELIWRYLDQHSFPVPDAIRRAEYELYHGDLLEGGRGEILLNAATVTA